MEGTNQPAAQGLRFNQGKIRYDLISTHALRELAKVMSYGAQKYDDRNWEKGLLWIKSCCASLERHLMAFKSGEDFDEESGELHIAHVMANASFIAHFYFTHPELDDRPHLYLGTPKIGLDIDEVLADFVGAYTERYGVQPVECWNFDEKLVENLNNELKDDKTFWMNIKRKINPQDIPFEPHCYVTSRVIPSEWTTEWLQKSGFPLRTVVTVGHEQSKVEAVKASGATWFIDDRWENFKSLNEAGICCFLWDAPHNQRYQVGYKRLSKMSDLLHFQNFKRQV